MVGLLALGAFTLSFDALRELAIMAGLRERLAWLWPLIVDGFIVVATAAAVVMRGRSLRKTWYPWATLILFASISVAGNALHAQSAADTTRVAVTIAAIVSAVPAVALLLASHLFVMVIDTPGSPTETEPDVAPNTVELQGSPTPTPEGPGPRGGKKPDDKPAEHIEPQPSIVPEPEPVRSKPSDPTEGELPVSAVDIPVKAEAAKRPTPRPVKPPRASGTDWETWINDQLDDGRDLTGTEVAEHFGVSPATGRRRLASVKANRQAAGPSTGLSLVANDH